jgi:hypothetical protein
MTFATSISTFIFICFFMVITHKEAVTTGLRNRQKIGGRAFWWLLINLGW